MHRIILTLFTLISLVLPSTAAAADLDTMIGQMLMAGFRGFEAPTDSPIIRDIEKYHLGGIILFDYDVMTHSYERNIKNPAQVKKLVSDLKAHADIPLLTAIDQEGGKVQRLKPKYGFKGTPSAAVLGAGNDKDVEFAAMSIGYMLHKLGFNLDFAPLADVNVNPESPAIGKMGRSFSADPNRVAQCDEIFLTELKRQGVIGCLKHFPGHGSAGSDSHKGLTDVTNTWTAQELIPYRLLIKKGEPKVIMTAHIFNEKLDPKYPATLSKRIITGLLRKDLGFNGVVITDDMTMKAITSFYGQAEAISLSIQAGADILLFGNNIDYDADVVPKAHAIIRKFVDDGVISKQRITQSYDRIMRLKSEL
ncbi:glycoside hydrolase family 3 N-terminal domain-containing protein [uncultured Pseudodesulfovibrio sp.]|uniref:glycoside hydrolase family 3 protein n=1 Tax=uncultured Pseudodesulfovibrio sp. TaxID=2035858 RepID=UPI0029C767CF|nr:glycoside hydrolase family 3 N-terminal domain-containing protein [uncultured Pseudodesulfovibrio sp.]